MTDNWRVKWMIDSAPDGARLCYMHSQDQYGRYDLVAVACDDWSAPECPVWVYIDTGQAARASRAADAAEDAATRAEGWAAAAEAAYRLVRAAADADAAAVERVAAVERAEEAEGQAYDAIWHAREAADSAHDAALEAADAHDDTDRAAAADAASAAAARAIEAARVVGDACAAALAAAIDAGVDADAISAACDREAEARECAAREYRVWRQSRGPYWSLACATAGRFGGEPRQALEALAKEYLGVRV
jgi:hypothetical protein